MDSDFNSSGAGGFRSCAWRARRSPEIPIYRYIFNHVCVQQFASQVCLYCNLQFLHFPYGRIPVGFLRLEDTVPGIKLPILAPVLPYLSPPPPRSRNPGLLSPWSPPPPPEFTSPFPGPSETGVFGAGFYGRNGFYSLTFRAASLLPSSMTDAYH